MGSGSESFAVLLGDLKERSGLSYGVLAKRLHVGTSTLHRYVQGDTVPSEYGVIEKFARLTGASAAEMATLYRLWMAAVEARSSTGAEAAAETVADPVPGPAPDAVPDSVPESTLAIESSETPGAYDAPQKRRRLLPALAVVAVVGVGAAVAGAAFATSGGSSPQQSAGAGATSMSFAPSSLQGSTSLQSFSAAPTSSSSSSAPPNGATTSASSSSASTTSASSAPSAPTTPIAVTIRPYQWEDKCNQWYLLNRKPSEVPPPPTEQDARGWANALGAVPAGTEKIELAVQGTGSNTVVLSGLHIRTVSKAAPLAWSAYSMASGCGSGMMPASFNINLDANRPLATPTPGQQGDTVVPAVDFPFKVSASDPQVLTIYAHAHAVNVAWYLELDWSSGDRSGTVRIDDHGKAFQTSGAQGRPIFDYDTGSNSWLKDDTAVVQ